MSLHAQNVVYFILLVIAAACFLAAMVNVVFPRQRAGVQANPRIPFNLVAAGLLFWVVVVCCQVGQAAFH